MRPLVSVLLALALAACGGGDGDDGENDDQQTVARWAAQVCSAAQSYADGFAELDDGIDAPSLTVDARRERAMERASSFLRLFDNTAVELRAIVPGAGTDDYHDALVLQFEALHEELSGQLEPTANATTHEEIEELNARLGIVLAETDEEIEEAAGDLPDDVRAALRSVTRCGNIIT